MNNDLFNSSLSFFKKKYPELVIDKYFLFKNGVVFIAYSKNDKDHLEMDPFYYVDYIKRRIVQLSPLEGGDSFFESAKRAISFKGEKI